MTNLTEPPLPGVPPSKVVPAASGMVAFAAARLRAGQLVAFPTETVYGLGADADQPEAVARIFAAKGRPKNHPLIVHVADLAAVDYWVHELTAEARALFEKFSPGPLTLVLPRAKYVNDIVTGGQDSIAVRIPAHPVARALLTAFVGMDGRGVAAPSANRFGHVSPTTAQHVSSDLRANVDVILDGGPTTHGIESTIVALLGETAQLLRPGTIAPEALEEVLGRPLIRKPDNAPRAPGGLASHYAPDTAAWLVPGRDLDKALATHRLHNKRVALLLRTHTPFRQDPAERMVRLPMDAAGYAHGLYAALRSLDAAHADVLLIETVPDSEEWLGVRDRLERATALGDRRRETGNS